MLSSFPMNLKTIMCLNMFTPHEFVYTSCFVQTNGYYVQRLVMTAKGYCVKCVFDGRGSFNHNAI